MEETETLQAVEENLKEIIATEIREDIASMRSNQEALKNNQKARKNCQKLKYDIQNKRKIVKYLEDKVNEIIHQV